ncbi:MAG: glycosyltransferase family 4 protein [Rhodospirillaceae bacterium]|nr:glycosyltransferase family 4 protein [Rhodospirillaceae bacterium]MBT5459855.1 glycosyltransferase family 4 protein [Rhodospirillaceae bacterium]
MTTARRTLILTLPPHIPGGVAVQTRQLAVYLRSKGHEVTIAYYATPRLDPDLAIQLPHLFSGSQPAIRRERCFGDFDGVAVGCRFPELEVSYTNDSSHWRALIADHDRHLAVGGTVLASSPLAAANIPHLVWCASDVIGDRFNRRQAMSSLRRIYDHCVVTPLLRSAERRVLRGCGRLMAISPFTEHRLRRLITASDRQIAQVPIPVDTAKFSPRPDELVPGRVGFVARLSDPRKNIPLLLRAVARLRRHIPGVELVLAGAGGTTLAQQIEALGLNTGVTFVGHLATDDLAALYRTFDVFAIPSHQEGLSIVGLEAMACGTPVVSTRCGGPEAFVTDDQTGFLVDFDENDLASAIARILQDRGLRDRLAKNAHDYVEAHYSQKAFETAFTKEWQAAWQEDP